MVYADDIRDKSSEMSLMAGAPDPTFGGFHDDKSQWQLSLDLLKKRLDSDLESMIRTRSYVLCLSFYFDTYGLRAC